MAIAKGYDVSGFRQGIPADAEFVFIKASEGGHTDQPGYAEKLAEARHRGLVVGHYHVLHAENPVEGEIEHFCRVVGQVPAGELLVLDFEPYGQSVSDADATVAKNRWLAAVRQRYPNNRVGLYTNRDYWFRSDGTAGDFLWIADHVEPGAPRIEAPWLFHQYAHDPLDAEIFHGSPAELRTWTAGGAAPGPDPATAVPERPWPGLQLVSREQWGARPWREPEGSIPYAGPRAGVEVHYLGVDYDFGAHDTCAGYVQQLQASHMDREGWSDIGYSLVVCAHGTVFEGSGLQRRSRANGDTRRNEAHYAVCGLVGSSGATEPTPEQLNGLRDAIEYCRQRGPAGREIKGHRDGYSTDCPGPALYAWVLAGAPRPPGTTIAPPKPAEAPTPVPGTEQTSTPVPPPAQTPTPVPGKEQDLPSPPVVVSHANVVAAARRDPGAAPGATSHPDDVRPVKRALAAEGLLDRASVDGSFDVRTIEAYAALQRRYGYTGQLADGIPGVGSLTRLGRAHGFTVT